MTLRLFAIVALLCSTLVSTVALAQPAETQGEIIDQIIGIVGNEILLQSELENDLLQQRMQGLDPDGDSRCQTIEDLLFQKLLLNQARFDSLVVTEGEVQSQIESRLEYFLSMFGSVDAFEKEYGKTIAQWKSEFREPIEEQLLIQQMQYKLEAKADATPKDVQRYYKSIPTDSLPLISEEIRYSQIVYQPEPSLAEKEALRMKADSIRNLVASGQMKMTIAALRHSDDPGSKYKGGCYTEVRRGMFVPEFEGAVYNTDVGSVSNVFESPFGYHFLQVTEKRGEVFSACHVLFSPKVKDEDLLRGESFLDSLGQVIRNDSLAFSDAALRHSTDEETKNQGGKVANFQQGGMKHGVDALERDIFLVLAKMQVGEVSAPVMRESPGGSPYFVIYRLDDRSAAHQANLRDDYLLFKQMAEADIREKNLEKWMEKKLKTTYIRLNDDFQSCSFKYPWINTKL
jgi:peptidyl-prolyl cis-trans isomerase SurA